MPLEVLAMLFVSASFLATGGADPFGVKEASARLKALSAIAVSLGEASSRFLELRPAFNPTARAVTNWRAEAASSLELPPGTFASLVDGAEPPKVARCVKLNNYWCVKRAGWAGEIAADAEGHVAFATALEGAIVTAMLLRRYYSVYHRRSALEILSRWAPAQCGLALSAKPGFSGPALAKQALPRMRRLRASRQRFLAPLGMGNTLRARWLAAHRGPSGGAAAAILARKTPPRSSIIPDPMLRPMRAPEIAIGMGESATATAAATTESVARKVAAFEPPPPAAPAGRPACANETQRIRNYALRAIEGIAASPDEDLRLFAPDGAPGANLPRLMANMARVEIGPLAAQPELIEQAVQQEVQRSRAAAALAASQASP